MYDFHYNFIKKNFDAEFLFTDMDSLTYEIFFLYIYIYIIMVLHRHLLNKKFTITRHQNILRVSGNEKKTNITKYFFKKYIYRYILLEYFILNIYTK